MFTNLWVIGYMLILSGFIHCCCELLAVQHHYILKLCSHPELVATFETPSLHVKSQAFFAALVPTLEHSLKNVLKPFVDRILYIVIP